MITRPYLHEGEARYGNGRDEDRAVLLISVISCYLCLCLFDVPLLLLLSPSALALQEGALLAAGCFAAAAVQLIPIVVVLATVIDAPLPLTPPGRAVGLCIARLRTHC
jgi:hypothetical protein